MEFKILSENTVYNEGLIAEHGLSIYFTYKGQKYLFDTGQSQVLVHNARQLNINLPSLSGIFISHDHYDHNGGLQEVLQMNRKIPVYTHPDILKNHPEIKNGRAVREASEIVEGMWLSGEIAPGHDWGDHKYAKEAATENSLYIDTPEGLIVLVGCSHPGIVRILKRIEELSGGKKIKAVIGGMHLINKGKKELKEIAREFDKLNIDKVSPLHCSGFKAARIFSNLLGDKVEIPAVGDNIIL